MILNIDDRNINTADGLFQIYESFCGEKLIMLPKIILPLWI